MNLPTKIAGVLAMLAAGAATLTQTNVLGDAINYEMEFSKPLVIPANLPILLTLSTLAVLAAAMVTLRGFGLQSWPSLAFSLATASVCYFPLMGFYAIWASAIAATIGWLLATGKFGKTSPALP